MTATSTPLLGGGSLSEKRKVSMVSSASIMTLVGAEKLIMGSKVPL
ncbi:hypothetical protein CWATWH0005_4591 [Crocosphaera watsonii WH 0005]|uniref:Uncharacterized protein n=1 Tax=Crocosphaera watsonii WH 0005 TaxID=423472 RepID=T2J342_CROWT|nr:hypothetical protein CWATWH0005_4591 [Crocosphaera watsonii WH 0005]